MGDPASWLNTFLSVYSGKIMVYSGLACDKPCYNNACLRLRNISDSRSTTLRKLLYTTSVGNYPPDWSVSFRNGALKHIVFIAKTKTRWTALSCNRLNRRRSSVPRSCSTKSAPPASNTTTWTAIRACSR